MAFALPAKFQITFDPEPEPPMAGGELLLTFAAGLAVGAGANLIFRLLFGV